MLSNLNNRQLEAVSNTEGPMLILAGAGSGKTRVLTTKIAYLIDELGVDSGSILAITFTNKAAQEMKERVQKLLNRPIDSMWIGTFHSIAVRILRINAEKIGYTNNFTIYDRDDQRSLLKEIYSEINLSDKVIKYSTAIANISKAKTEGVSPEDYWEVYGDDFMNRKIADIYELYEKKKKEYNSFDFDDLIIKAIELLNCDDDTLSYFQRKFKYVFVDEYQDTNKSQYEMVKLFSGYHENVCVVGDGDQSIYGWRGADISNILDFEEDFPGAKVVLLEENYRSTSGILDAANRVIKNNEQRKDKNLWTSRTGGQKPIYKEVNSEDGEARAVVEWIDHLVYNGEKLSEMAILYRTNAQSRQFEEALVHAQIPYVVVGGLKFYERKEIKDLLAYLRIIVNPMDDISLKRIINEPKRGIGAAGLGKLEDAALNNGMSIVQFIMKTGSEAILGGKAASGLLEFKKIISKSVELLDEKSLAEAVHEIVNLTGIPADLKNEGTVESRTRLENIESFVSSIASYQAENPDADLEDYLASVSLMSDVDKTDAEKSGINLMTIHAAKGLEYKTIFLTGVEEGLFPSKFSIDEDNVEEERRLFYVALTRAKDNLYLTSTTIRRSFGQIIPSKKSRFVEELGDSIEEVENILRNKYSGSVVENYKETSEDVNWDKNYLKYDIESRRESFKKSTMEEYMMGEKVKHKKFGIGTIINVNKKDDNTSELMISFENMGIKKLRSDLAPLERVK